MGDDQPYEGLKDPPEQPAEPAAEPEKAAEDKDLEGADEVAE
jgi:hypothetical protein